MRLYDCRNIVERDQGIEAAISAVKSGDLVVLPTDTVYGVGADAFKSWSVTALLNAKGRGRNVPPPVLVGSRHTLDGLVARLPEKARDLVEAFWHLGRRSAAASCLGARGLRAGDEGGVAVVADRVDEHLEVARAAHSG